MATPIVSATVAGQAAPVRPGDNAASRRTEGQQPAVQEVPQQSVDVNDVLQTLQETGRDFVFGNRTIQFSYNEEAQRIVVKVMSEDGEIVRQIPPEEYLQFAARIREQLGVLLDEII